MLPYFHLYTHVDSFSILQKQSTPDDAHVS